MPNIKDLLMSYRDNLYDNTKSEQDKIKTLIKLNILHSFLTDDSTRDVCSTHYNNEMPLVAVYLNAQSSVWRNDIVFDALEITRSTDNTYDVRLSYETNFCLDFSSLVSKFISFDRFVKNTPVVEKNSGHSLKIIERDFEKRSCQMFVKGVLPEIKEAISKYNKIDVKAQTLETRKEFINAILPVFISNQGTLQVFNIGALFYMDFEVLQQICKIFVADRKLAKLLNEFKTLPSSALRTLLLVSIDDLNNISDKDFRFIMKTFKYASFTENHKQKDVYVTLYAFFGKRYIEYLKLNHKNKIFNVRGFRSENASLYISTEVYRKFINELLAFSKTAHKIENSIYLMPRPFDHSSANQFELKTIRTIREDMENITLAWLPKLFNFFALYKVDDIVVYREFRHAILSELGTTFARNLTKGTLIRTNGLLKKNKASQKEKDYFSMIMAYIWYAVEERKDELFTDHNTSISKLVGPLETMLRGKTNIDERRLTIRCFVDALLIENDNNEGERP